MGDTFLIFFNPDHAILMGFCPHEDGIVTLLAIQKLILSIFILINGK